MDMQNSKTKRDVGLQQCAELVPTRPARCSVIFACERPTCLVGRIIGFSHPPKKSLSPVGRTTMLFSLVQSIPSPLCFFALSVQSRGMWWTYPETSLTTSRTKAVRLLRWPLVRETRGLGWRGVTFCMRERLVSMLIYVLRSSDARCSSRPRLMAIAVCSSLIARGCSTSTLADKKRL